MLDVDRYKVKRNRTSGKLPPFMEGEVRIEKPKKAKFVSSRNPTPLWFVFAFYGPIWLFLASLPLVTIMTLLCWLFTDSPFSWVYESSVYQWFQRTFGIR